MAKRKVKAQRQQAYAKAALRVEQIRHLVNKYLTVSGGIPAGETMRSIAVKVLRDAGAQGIRLGEADALLIQQQLTPTTPKLYVPGTAQYDDTLRKLRK